MMPRTALRSAVAGAALCIPALAGAQHVHQAGTPSPIPGARVVPVRAVEYAFADMPASIPAGLTTFRLTNVGKELHHIWIVRLDEGRTAKDFLAAAEEVAKGAPVPKWVVDLGGPNAGVPGMPMDGTVDLQPGRYLLLCHIPSPSDGVPHLAKGMMKEFTVTGPATKQPKPKADVTMHLSDYAFTLSEPLAAGTRTIEFVNDAAQPHEALIARLAPGKTARDLAAWIEGGQKGEPPAMPMGGATGLASGASMYFTAAFEPGRYALLCFVPDAKDGKPHVAHGMLREIEVR